jgi:hypothetical protein
MSRPGFSGDASPPVSEQPLQGQPRSWMDVPEGLGAAYAASSELPAEVADVAS